MLDCQIFFILVSKLSPTIKTFLGCVSPQDISKDFERNLTPKQCAVLEGCLELTKDYFHCAGKGVTIVNIAQIRYYAQGEPLALTADNELRKLPPVTSDLRRLTKQVDRRAFHYNTAQRETRATTITTIFSHCNLSKLDISSRLTSVIGKQKVSVQILYL